MSFTNLEISSIGINAYTKEMTDIGITKVSLSNETNDPSLYAKHKWRLLPKVGLVFAVKKRFGCVLICLLITFPAL